MQIVRGCDVKRNVLVYMVYSDRIIEGSPKNSTWQLIRPRLFEPLRNNLRDLIRVAIHHHHVAVSLNPERRQIDPIRLHTSAGKGGVIAL